MEVKNLFEPAVKQEIEDRINRLTSQSLPKWGKMNVAQMLAHLQEPMAIALDGKSVKVNWLMKMIFPLFKSKLWDDKPYKQNLPTSPSFITYGSEKDFEKEKHGLLNMVNRFTEANILSDRHPVFGKLTKENWSKATWKHIDHHLQQFGV
ncbi:MAG TPA: DUF1569 domain-containing protein [Chitinophagaceae bacterium]|jgi:hypothetical protein|nr:DUF1569 domain-containing protein [Chitinophagaceae bacterium]OPZ17920.1 MAG: hypothetical protein BWZ05_01135 [Bacteroidetes bacterium ADurb.BinA245]HMW67490.1 DUF1569 domain-containing protein [Chitinophagaceae bacterium]HMX78550.1 DUF1569 domain-containing protein [Chitinophagaceae bacterium]HNA19560.1 DUF1569 domain-containing protein [Chitinophagaceae bacterium]